MSHLAFRVPVLLGRAATLLAMASLFPGVARATDVTIPRWQLHMETPTNEPWAVEDSGSRVVVRRTDDQAGFVLEVHAQSGCGAGSTATPPLALEPPWIYAGRVDGVDGWCLPATGGTVTLAFLAKPDDEVLGLVGTIGRAELSVYARPPAAERAPRYSLVIYPTMRRFMPRSRADVVPGRAVISAGWTDEAHSTARYGSGPDLGYDVHAMRGLALGFDGGAGVRSAPQERAGLTYHVSGVAGVGGWPVDWLGAAAMVGVGVDALAEQAPPSLLLPAEALVVVGASRYGVEVLARAELAVGGDRGGIDSMGPFDGASVRVAGWLGESDDAGEYDYLDYGRRSFWVGGFYRHQWDRRWVGVQLGYALTALPVR